MLGPCMEQDFLQKKYAATCERNMHLCGCVVVGYRVVIVVIAVVIVVIVVILVVSIVAYILSEF